MALPEASAYPYGKMNADVLEWHMKRVRSIQRHFRLNTVDIHLPQPAFCTLQHLQIKSFRVDLQKVNVPNAVRGTLQAFQPPPVSVPLEGPAAPGSWLENGGWMATRRRRRGRRIKRGRRDGAKDGREAVEKRVSRFSTAEEVRRLVAELGTSFVRFWVAGPPAGKNRVNPSARGAYIRAYS